MFIRLCRGRKKSEKFVSTEGSVTVTTNISGASVSVVTGSTIVATASAVATSATSAAITIPNIKNGTYTVIVSKEGYESASKIVAIAGDDQTIDMPLTAVAKVATLSAISAIDSKNLTVTATFEGDVDEAKAANSSLTLTKGDKKVTAKFAKFVDKNTVTYAINSEEDIKTMKPGDATANGEYAVASDTFLTAKNLVTTYEEALVGNAVAGFVTGILPNGDYGALAGAEVTVKGGQSTKTDEYGYYQIAATNGVKTVSAKKDGYITNIVNQKVNINRNHVTSQNFILEKFELKNVYAKVTVKDEDGTAVSGAKAKLYDGDKLIGTTTTNASGEVLFANHNAISKDTEDNKNNINAFNDNATVGSGDDSKNGLVGTTTQNVLEAGKTYTIKVEKRIAENNLNDVHTLKTVTFTVENKYDHEVSVTSHKVKKINSIKITQNFTTAAQKLLGEISNVNVKYELYTTVNNKTNGSNATDAEPLVAESGTTKTSQTVAGSTSADATKLYFAGTGDAQKKSATAELVNADVLLPADAALPTGDYYLVIKTDNDSTKDTTNSDLAYVVVKISVVEGQKAEVTATIDEGYTRRLNSVVGLGADESRAIKEASLSVSDPLRTVERQDNAAAPYKISAADSGANNVKANHKVYQVMADKVKVPVLTGVATDVTKNAKGTFSFEGTYSNFNASTDYEFSTEGDYIVNKSANQNISNIVNTDLNMETYGAWNLFSGKITVAGDLVGKDASSMPYVKKITIKDEAGKVVKEKDLNIPTTGTPNGASTTWASGDVLSFNINDVTFNKASLPAGKYTVEYKLDGYLPVSTPLTSMAGLEKVSDLKTTANLVKDPYADKAGVKGVIKVKADDGTYFNDTDLTNSVKDGIVTLINSEGKIAGVGKVQAPSGGKAEYSVLDADANGSKVPAGVYTLVVRFKNSTNGKKVENKIIKNVVVESNKQSEVNIETVEGGQGYIKATVQSDTFATIPSLKGVAYDEAYVDITNTANFVNPTYNLASVTSDDELLGKYSATVNGKLVEIKTVSAGKYTLKFNNAPDNNYAFTTGENVVIQDVNQKLYPTYTYKYNGSGSNLVDIDVKVTNTEKDSIVVLAKDKDGKIIDKLYTKAAKSAEAVTLKVPSGATYTVEVYTQNGNQVASKSVNVQTVKTTIDMSTYDPADQD